MSELITDEIVEQAARGWWDWGKTMREATGHGRSWDELDDDERALVMSRVRTALAPAAPLIAGRAQLDLLADLLAKGMWDVRYVENEYPIQAVPKSLLLEYRNRISRGMKGAPRG
jgi:hypothetical protein